MNKYSALIAAFLLVCGMATAAFAKSDAPGVGMEIDGSIGFGTGPNDFDPGIGFNFGAGYMIPDLPLQGRIDVSYFDFSKSFFGTDVSFTRIPIAFGARYYFPMTDNVKAFAQAGLEISMDKAEAVIPWFIGRNFVPLKQSVSETNVGGTVGGGIEFFVVPNFSIFGLARAHLISDSYFSMHFGAAFHF